MAQIVDNPALFAAGGIISCLIVIQIGLALTVSQQRGAAKISLGDGGDALLLRRIRMHANFTENVPIGVAAMLAMALSGSSRAMVLLVGIMLIVGRIAHAQGLNASPGRSVGRMIGTLLTWVSLLVAAGVLLMRALIG